MKYVFDITPIGKPRMTQSDRWKRRDCVVSYFEFKDSVNVQAKLQHYVISEILDIEFYIPMPRSYSAKRRFQLLGTPHREKPDIDNLLKAFMDSLTIEDKKIHTIYARKFWSNEGKIIVSTEDDQEFETNEKPLLKPHYVSEILQ